MQYRPVAGRPPALPVSLAQYRRRAANYDAELAPFEPYRARAIALLQLQPGQRVLDVGCGTGLSFALLQEAVGVEGRVLAFDPSPDMLALARDRVRHHGWHNIAVLQAGADCVQLQGQADAVLFHFTHDVLRDEACIAHVLAHVKPGGRVVATGLQWAPPWMAGTNAFVLAAALYSVSSLEGLHKPWDLLGPRLRELQVQSAMMGGIYIASGRVAEAH